MRPHAASQRENKPKNVHSTPTRLPTTIPPQNPPRLAARDRPTAKTRLAWRRVTVFARLVRAPGGEQPHAATRSHVAARPRAHARVRDLSTAPTRRAYLYPHPVYRSRIIAQQNQPMDRRALAELNTRTHGVVTRAELDTTGIGSSTVTRRLRDGEWTRPFRGIYFLFPGPPSADQRVIATAKWAGDDDWAFTGTSAAYLHGLIREPPSVLRIVVPANSGRRSNQRCKVTRTESMPPTVGSPPRTTLAHTVADLVHAAPSRSDALAEVITGIQKRMDLDQFVALISRRRRLRHRKYLKKVLEIAADGVESQLELTYCRDVERRHGLPRSIGQRRERIRGRWIRSDRWYANFRTRAELDGELAHPGRATDADLIRDNDVLLALGDITLRYRWPHVTRNPCLVAAQVSRALRLQGWRGQPTRCSYGCRVHEHLADLGDRAA